MLLTPAVSPWRTYPVEVRAVHRLSPSFLRVTFTGADLDRFADNGYDQRVKLAFPLPGEHTVTLPDGVDWYQRWRALPDRRRPPLRTYTVRHVRPPRREVDIDFVLHGDGGPASHWAQRATAGNPLAIVGPDAGYDGDHGGVEFRTPKGAALLLAGDETATPAICAILERLPADACGHAILEVPRHGDILPITAPAGVHVTWLPRDTAPHGSRLIEAVAAATPVAPAAPGPKPAAAPGPKPAAAPLPAEDDTPADSTVYWEVPDGPVPEAPLYAWLAGESSVIRRLRRHLVTDHGLDRRAVAFMGYWRHGHADPD